MPGGRLDGALFGQPARRSGCVGIEGVGEREREGGRRGKVSRREGGREKYEDLV